MLAVFFNLCSCVMDCVHVGISCRSLLCSVRVYNQQGACKGASRLHMASRGGNLGGLLRRADQQNCGSSPDSVAGMRVLERVCVSCS